MVSEHDDASIDNYFVHQSQSSVFTLEQMHNLKAQIDHMMTMLNQSSQPNSYYTYSPEDHMARMITSCFTTAVHQKNKWVIDTGATYHMCCDITLMTEVKSICPPIIVSLPTRLQIEVVKAGTVRITQSLVLHNVIHIPSFQFNLLSVSKNNARFSAWTQMSCVLEERGMTCMN